MTFVHKTFKVQSLILFVSLCTYQKVFAHTFTKSTQSRILNLLSLRPSDLSVDYIQNKKQFQVHTLLTEQRHPLTMQIDKQLEKNTIKGLRSLLEVDKDISLKFRKMTTQHLEMKKLEAASRAIQQAILSHKKIYVYGTGSTGRLAKQIESSLWRPFWKKLQNHALWEKLASHFPDVQNQLVGEITGGDRALISSLAGFEDLQLIGQLQLKDHHVQKGDVVFAITEGGETSAVIGTILANKAASVGNLYFVYNNPDALLHPFIRSQKVLSNPLITKINLTTGPQALAGSTRMQAATSEMFVMGIIVENAIQNILKLFLSSSELKHLGFTATIQQRLLGFERIQKAIYRAAPALSTLTKLESETYRHHGYTTYIAKEALLTAFTDSTERAPTFHLHPLDTVAEEKRKSWIQIVAPVSHQQEAWFALLHRPFYGMKEEFYRSSFESQIHDPHLRQVALASLKQAGNAQKDLYDFSYSTLEKNKLTRGDLGAMFLFSGENPTDADFKKGLDLFMSVGAPFAIVAIAPDQQWQDARKKITNAYKNVITIEVPLPPGNDPLKLNQQIALKMLLNAHSTAIMAKLGRVVGNTMVDVNPGNLKLIDRANTLIKIHVNSVVSSKKWTKKHSYAPLLTYKEANAVLFDIMAYDKKSKLQAEFSEVSVSIVRILESFKCQCNFSWGESIAILQHKTLRAYLENK